MHYQDAVELKALIKFDYPHLLLTVLKMHNGGYGVHVAWYTFAYDKYCCLEHEQVARMHDNSGWYVDIPADNGLLLRPIYHDGFVITSRGQWYLLEVMSGIDGGNPKKNSNPHKRGRPRKNTPPSRFQTGEKMSRVVERASELSLMRVYG